MDSTQRVRSGRDRTRFQIGFGFDLDHTLLVDNHLERIAFMRLLETLAAGGGSRLTGAPKEERAIDDLLARQRAGAFTIEEAVRRFAAGRGVVATPALIDDYKTSALDMAQEFVRPVPGAASTLRALRERGVPVAALTNGWSPLQERKAACIGFEGPVVVSSLIGAQKPDPRAFAALADAMGLHARDLWYVGDDPRCDVAGALGAGMRAVWFDERGAVYPSDVARPTRTIGALPELLDLE
ncbi:MAG TPA: HAD family hydrolase [Candidatus Baltobacteraceae bacterium]